MIDFIFDTLSDGARCVGILFHEAAKHSWDPFLRDKSFC